MENGRPWKVPQIFFHRIYIYLWSKTEQKNAKKLKFKITAQLRFFILFTQHDQIMLSSDLHSSKTETSNLSVLKFPQIWPIFSLQENMWGAPNSGCAEQRCDYSVLPVSLWVLIALPWFSRCWTMLLPDQHQKPLQKGYYVCLCLSVL